MNPPTPEALALARELMNDNADGIYAPIAVALRLDRFAAERAGRPCIACPVEVRGLYSVAFNLCNLYRHRADDPERVQRKLHKRMQELQDAVNVMEPHVEAHFADRAHSHPSAAARQATESGAEGKT